MTNQFVRDERRSIRLRGLTEVSRALTYAVSFDEVLQLTAQRAATLLEARAAVLLLSDETGVMSIRAASGVAAAEPALRRSLDDALVEQLHRVLGVSAERFFGVPLVVNGEVTGLLAVGLPDELTGTSEEHEWLLSALADQAAVALEKTRLDERGRFRDRLIGIVSHDLRNPINTVLLGTSVLLDGATLDPYTIKTLTRIQSAAERAERMISDLLDYTQAYLGGGIRIERSPNDLAAIAQQAVDEIEIAHPEDEFEVEIVGDTCADVDADRVAQMLGNLLSNAVSYSPPGTRVRVELRGEAACVVLAVHNHGIAIPADRVHDIFQPMQQVTPGAGRSKRSVGLGLYIVQSIVASHDGTIRVMSSDEAGTTFTVTLPRRAKA